MTIATAGSVVNASPASHQHGHAHVDKRIVKVVDVPGPIVVAYELNGKLIDQSEVCEGITSGTLKWVDGSNALPDCSKGTEPVSRSTEIPATSSPAAAAKVSSQNTPAAIAPPAPFDGLAKEDIKVSSTPISKASATLASSPSPNLHPQGQSSSSTSNSLSGGQGLHSEFPDGELDCSTFPVDYGPINIEWAGLGGWSGIQYVTIEGDSVTHIDTAIPGGAGCKPGAMCSYACPAGYQKSQWPPQQGSTGQSVGGLHCDSNGKLALTNPGLSKNLCIQGTGAVTVQNKLSNNAAICRTDYPGLY